MLSFLESARFRSSFLRNDSIVALLTTPELALQIPDSVALGVCEDPRLAFAELHNHLAATTFYCENVPTCIDPTAYVHPRAWIAEQNVNIGPHTKIGPNATVLERCTVGAKVTVGAGAVLGGVGFQTVRSSSSLVEMHHAGGLVVRDGAYILHGAVIATGMFRNDTEIGQDARIGAQSFISHGVRIGKRAFVGHGAMLNGNVVVGDEAWIGPGSVIAQNLNVGSQAFVSLGSIVVRDVDSKQRVSGNFAIAHRRLLRHIATMEVPTKPV